MKPSKERILQISNDISEDMVCATKSELIEVARYWMLAHTDACNKHQARFGEFSCKLLDLANETLKP